MSFLYTVSLSLGGVAQNPDIIKCQWTEWDTDSAQQAPDQDSMVHHALPFIYQNILLFTVLLAISKALHFLLNAEWCHS